MREGVFDYPPTAPLGYSSGSGSAGCASLVTEPIRGVLPQITLRSAPGWWQGTINDLVYKLRPALILTTSIAVSRPSYGSGNPQSRADVGASCGLAATAF